MILEQQKYNEKLQQELARLQKHANILEHEGVIEPSILFTRLDIDRNDQSLRKAIDQGKMSDTKYEVGELKASFSSIGIHLLE